MFIVGIHMVNGTKEGEGVLFDDVWVEEKNIVAFSSREHQLFDETYVCHLQLSDGTRLHFLEMREGELDKIHQYLKNYDEAKRYDFID